MSLHRFSATQRLPVTLDTAWGFFTNPYNLATITPSNMGFEVLGEVPARMHAGLIIRHRVRPLLRIPVTWITEISQLEEGRFFVDEQRFGPYRFWHHQHHFRTINGGVEMRDIVHYDVGFGLVGELVNLAAVRPRLRQIFTFRREVLEQRFGGSVAASR